MYSIVMVAAMTAAPATPDFFFHNRGGCSGCYGGCHGWSTGCTGCCGGWVSHGCCGGWSCGGCCGGWGCHGFFTVRSGCCGGCQGYYTSCQGYSCYGGLSLGGGGISMYGPPGTGGYGQHFSPNYSQAGYGFAQGPPIPYFTPVLAAVPATGVPEAVATLPATRAQVVVRVPADAKLFADGQATQLSGSERVFLTPDLSGSRDFQYNLKIEYAVNGETKSEAKQVVVRAGHRTVIEFGTPASEKASSSVTVNMPEKAKLFVDNVETAATAGKHTFQTPELPKGKAFVYEFRAEVEKDGKTETVSQKVTFNAGEPVNVDFTDVVAVRTASK